MALLATLPNAIYSWWVHPLAVNDGSVAWVSSIDSAGVNHISRINTISGAVDDVALDGPTEVDEHNPGAIALNSSQADLIVFYARHDLDTHVRYQTVDRTNLALGTQQTLTFTGTCTYAQVLVLGNQVVLLTRSPNDIWRYRISPDWGATWGAEATLLDGSAYNQFYLVARPQPGSPATVHVATQGHPVNSAWRPVGYMRINLTSLAVTMADGTLLGSLGTPGGPALIPEDLERAVDPSGGDKCRVLDVGVVAGAPAIAFARWNGDLGPPSYFVTTWDGSWDEGSFALASGEPFGFNPETRYLGGMALGHDGSTLWTSRQTAGQWLVERWTRSAGGGYTPVEAVDRSATRRIRPYAAVGGSAGGLEWMYQLVRSYDGFREYDGDLLLQTAGATPTPAPAPPVAQAAIDKKTVTWYGVDAVTGRIIAELPDVRGEVSRLLSAYQSVQLTMPIPLKGSPGHVPIPLVEQATAIEGAALVAVVNKLPTWMGWVLLRDGGTGADLELGCVTPEGYLTRRRVRDHVFTQVDRAQIAAALIGDAGPLAGTGTGFGFEVDVQLTGDLIDRTYLASDRQFVYDALRELAADGLEFTCDLDWTDSTRTSVRKIMRVGPRIGVSTGGALFEATATSVLESQAGSEATYRLTEDYTTGKGANHVIAVAPGEGRDQPASAPAIDQAALDGGAPIVEHVFEVSSSAAVDQAALDRLAQAELARLRRGAQVWQIEARLDAYPRPGVDAQIGDDVSWKMKGHRHPTGVVGSGRMIGYVINQQAGRWRPILLEPGEQVVS